jgi:hypothetical protein
MRRAGRDAKQASVPLRRIRAGEPREKFLYELQAGPAGGLRPPSGPATTRRSPGTGINFRPDRHLKRTGHSRLSPRRPSVDLHRDLAFACGYDVRVHRHNNLA